MWILEIGSKKSSTQTGCSESAFRVCPFIRAKRKLCLTLDSSMWYMNISHCRLWNGFVIQRWFFVLSTKLQQCRMNLKGEYLHDHSFKLLSILLSILFIEKSDFYWLNYLISSPFIKWQYWSSAILTQIRTEPPTFHFRGYMINDHTFTHL